MNKLSTFYVTLGFTLIAFFLVITTYVKYEHKKDRREAALLQLEMSRSIDVSHSSFPFA